LPDLIGRYKTSAVETTSLFLRKVIEILVT